MLEKLMGDEIEIENWSSTDRYGILHLLSVQLNTKKPRRSFFFWQHGWTWWDDLLEPVDIIGAAKVEKSFRYIVSSQAEYECLRRNGYTNAVKGGLPFAYVPEQGVKRTSNSLLAFIDHSAESEKKNVFDANYLDFLASMRSSYEFIYVSIYSCDRTDALVREVKRRGLYPINGANPKDERSLVRTRIALEYCEEVSTNVFGSHIAYALALNCNVSLFTPLVELEKEIFLSSVFKNEKDYIDRQYYVSTETYLRSRYPHLFNNNPSRGVKDVALGNNAIGFSNKLNPDALRLALGWDLKSQFLGYAKGLRRRIIKHR